MDVLAPRPSPDVPAAQHAGAGAGWWHNASALAFALTLARHDPAEAHYRFGDARLAITAPPPLRGEVEERYGACAVPGATDAGTPTLRCTRQARADVPTRGNSASPA